MTSAASVNSRLHWPAGSAADGAWSVSITPQQAGWSWTGLRTVDLQAGESVTFDTGESEIVVLPLSGGCVVECESEALELAGRPDVFSAASDFAYVPCHATATVRSPGGGRFALPAARAQTRFAFRYAAAADVPVEARGAGACSRLVRNFCMPESFEASRLIACEVVTPGGNWSSYPPHKHDESRPGEAPVEEIYYFEVAAAPGGDAGAAYQRVYGTEERPIDILAEVRSGDVVLVPHGWHGPSMAMPGYDLYYLNAMAGPGERTWRAYDDPAHAWVRETWHEQQLDEGVVSASSVSRQP